MSLTMDRSAHPGKTARERSSVVLFHHLRDNPTDHLRLSFAGSSLKHVRPFETIRPENLHLPAIACLRSDNRYVPVPALIRQRVFNMRSNLLAVPRIGTCVMNFY